MLNVTAAAQAIEDAYSTEADRLDREVSDREMLAAALRAAAAHLPSSAMYPSSDWGHGWRAGINDARQALLAIAAELEGL